MLENITSVVLFNIYVVAIYVGNLYLFVPHGVRRLPRDNQVHVCIKYIIYRKTSNTVVFKTSDEMENFDSSTYHIASAVYLCDNN